MRKGVIAIVAVPLTCVTCLYWASGLYLAFDTYRAQAEVGGVQGFPPEADAIAQTESQLGRPLTAAELQSLHRYYEDPADELLGGSIIGIPLILLSTALIWYLVSPKKNPPDVPNGAAPTTERT